MAPTADRSSYTSQKPNPWKSRKNDTHMSILWRGCLSQSKTSTQRVYRHLVSRPHLNQASLATPQRRKHSRDTAFKTRCHSNRHLAMPLRLQPTHLFQRFPSSSDRLSFEDEAFARASMKLTHEPMSLNGLLVSHWRHFHES